VCVSVDRQVTEGQIWVEDAEGLARVEFTPTVQVRERVQNATFLCQHFVKMEEKGSGIRREECQ
jgi:hypothetical protein